MLQAPQGDDREAGRLAAAFMAAPHPLALIETEAGRSSLRVCNTAWERLTGYASADIAGKDLRALGLDLAWPHVGIAAADPIHAPATLRLADDRILSCWITAAPLPQETKDSYAVVAGFTAAAAEREVHIRAGGLAQSHLLAMIGHDLRQPLQTIVAALQLLGSAPPARAQQLLGYANAAATQLDQDLAAVAFLSAQQRGSALFLEEIALQPLLDEVMAAWIPQADLKSIKLRTVSTEARVTSHPQLLRSIVSNLVANAVKHTARGGVLIGVRRRGDDLAISVYDTGPRSSGQPMQCVAQRPLSVEIVGPGCGADQRGRCGAQRPGLGFKVGSHLVPSKREANGRERPRTRRKRRHRGRRPIIAQIIKEYASLALVKAGAEHVGLRRVGGERLAEPAGKALRHRPGGLTLLVRQGRDHVQTLAASGLAIRHKAGAFQPVLHRQGRFDDALEWQAIARVKVDHDAAGDLRLKWPAVPGMELHRRQLRRGRERVEAVKLKTGGPASGDGDPRYLRWGASTRMALKEPRRSEDAVRRANKGARPALHVAQHPRSHGLQVAGEVQFRNWLSPAVVRPQRPVRVGDRHAEHLSLRSAPRRTGPGRGARRPLDLVGHALRVPARPCDAVPARRRALTRRNFLHGAPGGDRGGQGLEQSRALTRRRPGVAALDQQPIAPARSGTPRHLHQRPPAFEPNAVEGEPQLAVLQHDAGVALGPPVAAIPYHHGASAILSLRDFAFKVAVVEGMVLCPYGQPSLRGIERGPLCDGPREKDAVELKPQIIVQSPRRMLLDDEPQPLCRSDGALASWFRCPGKVSLGAVTVESRLDHGLLHLLGLFGSPAFLSSGVP